MAGAGSVYGGDGTTSRACAELADCADTRGDLAKFLIRPPAQLDSINPERSINQLPLSSR